MLRRVERLSGLAPRVATEGAADDPAPGEAHDREPEIRDLRRPARREVELKRQLLQERRLGRCSGVLLEPIGHAPSKPGTRPTRRDGEAYCMAISWPGSSRCSRCADAESRSRQCSILPCNLTETTPGGLRRPKRSRRSSTRSLKSWAKNSFTPSPSASRVRTCAREQLCAVHLLRPSRMGSRVGRRLRRGGRRLASLDVR
jgi:hypothetical protein